MQEELKISRRTFPVAAAGTIISIGLPGVFTKLSNATSKTAEADFWIGSSSACFGCVPANNRSTEFAVN